MPALRAMCQKCGRRPGQIWDGSGGFSCLCGECKIKVVLFEDGPKYGIALPEEWLTAPPCLCPAPCPCHPGVDARFDTSDDDLEIN